MYESKQEQICDIPMITTKAKNKNVYFNIVIYRLEFSSNPSEAVQKID